MSQVLDTPETEVELRTEPSNGERLRVATAGASGVDREAGVIRGVILAEECVFKDSRGEFDRQAIRRVAKLANEKRGGLLSRFSHANDSNDSLGKHLGRVRNVKADTVLRERGKDASGAPLLKEVLVARGDLHLDPTALDEPIGGGKPLGIYIMDLASNDPEALGMSLVLKADQATRLDSRGRPQIGEDGKPLPPLWTPTVLHSVDAVGDGDATFSMLAEETIDGLPNSVVFKGCALLDQQFAGKDRGFVESRLTGFVSRYLSMRYGPDEDEADTDLEPEDEIGLSAQPAETLAPEPQPEPNDEALLLDLYLETEMAG